MKYIKEFVVYESNLYESQTHLTEGKNYDVPEFGSFSVSGKKLSVEFYNLDDWDSSMYGGGKGHKYAMKDIKMAAKGENDPLLDDIELHLGNSGLGAINWNKPVRVKDGGSTLEFVLESESVNEGFFAIAGGIILAVLGLKVLKSIAKKILVKVGSNIEVKPEKLTRLVDTIQEEAILNGGLKGKEILVLNQWATGLKEKINNGTIKTIGEIRNSIDPAAKEMFT